jgi:hypothetical protein
VNLATLPRPSRGPRAADRAAWRARLGECADDPDDLSEFAALRDRLQSADQSVLADAKRALCNGLREFETHGRRVIERGGPELVEALRSLAVSV